jgi:uncharacterized protein (TIGR00251 family)
MTARQAESMQAESFLREHPEGCSLAVRVQPGAKRTGISGVYGQDSRPHLNIALQAPPVDGRANEALIAYLAKLLSMPRSNITIIHGECDRFKLMLLEGADLADVQVAIEAKLPAHR